jgi:hypothetical protein
MLMQDVDFLIIGATKSATTWLQRSLQANPLVSMPDPELHYFSREYGRGDQWYLSQFPDDAGALIAGEKSNSYLESPEAAVRIASKLPDAKLVAQLRNPVERAYSHYCMMYRRGEVDRHIEAYLDPRNSTDQRLISGGFYCRQLRAYYDRFPSERLLVTFYETIEARPQQQLSTVRAFLGLPAGEASEPIRVKVKDKTTPMLRPGLRRLLRPMKPVVAPFRDNRYFRKLHSAFATEISYSPFPDEIRHRLIDHYAPDVEALGQMVGRDLSGWLRHSTIPSPDGMDGR